MKLYAVRLIETKEAVGIFWCNKPKLWWNVDIACDPGVCEYRALSGEAAIIWEGRTDLKFGVYGEDECGLDYSMKDGRMALSLDDMITDEQRKWTKLPYYDEPGGGGEKLFSSTAP